MRRLPAKVVRRSGEGAGPTVQARPEAVHGGRFYISNHVLKLNCHQFSCFQRAIIPALGLGVPLGVDERCLALMQNN
ncbi:hypothetical protein D3C85_1630280 [compost metagenome]